MSTGTDEQGEWERIRYVDAAIFVRTADLRERANGQARTQSETQESASLDREAQGTKLPA